MGLDQNPMLFPAPPWRKAFLHSIVQERRKFGRELSHVFFCLSYLSSGCPKIGSKWGFKFQLSMSCFGWVSTIKDLGYVFNQLMMIDDWWPKSFFFEYYPWLRIVNQDFEHYSSAGIPFVIYTEVQLAGAFPTSTTTRIWMHVSLLQLILCLKVKVRFSGPAIGPRFTGKLNYILEYLEWIRM